MSTSSSDEDDNFLRLHAKAIAEALQQQEASEQAVGGSGAATKSQREQLIHETYISLCHDDPRVQSDFACQCLATALLDPTSPYALSGPLVEGIRQLHSRDDDRGEQAATLPSTSNENKSNNTGSEDGNLTTATSASPKGSAFLAWAIYARIPLLCCQASNLSEVHTYLGSYRPPPPPNPVASEEDTDKNRLLSQAKNEQADQLAAMLSQPPPADNDDQPDGAAKDTTDGDDLEEEEEVWAAESDPSDFEFDSGFSYEQQITDVQDSFAAWMIDRSDPVKLSRPPNVTTWKQVRHAVMDLTSQLTYRKVQSLWTAGNTQAVTLAGSRGPSDILTQFTLTLLIPPPVASPAKSSRPSIFDSPDDEEDALQPQRQLQAMAWYPLWVVRDAAANVRSQNQFSQYLTLLQTLIAVDAANSTSATSKPAASMAPATYVGLASLSALCQQFVTDANQSSTSSTTSSETVERFRALRLSLWEISDDLTHALEQEESIRKSALKESVKGEEDSRNKGSGSDWIVWTLLPLFEILTNQRLLTGTTIVAKAESMAQKHHQQQSSQQWSGLLQSGLFRQWLLRLQGLRDDESSNSSSSALLWQLVRRSLLYVIAQSSTATSALGKYAWRFPKFVSVVEIGKSYQNPRQGGTDRDNDQVASFSDCHVDDILWNLLCLALAGGIMSTTAAPTIQWKSSAKKSPTSSIKPLPSRAECQQVSWEEFQKLCQTVVHVLELACQEENKKENLDQSASKAEGNLAEKTLPLEDQRLMHQLVLRSFHRLVDTIAACPLLAKLFVHDLEMAATGEETSGGISKCLDSIQEALSQYKAPPPADMKHPHQPKAKDEDATEDQTAELEPKRAKEESQSASMQEDIHMVRKVLKVARSLLASTPATLSSQNLTASSKTD